MPHHDNESTESTKPAESVRDDVGSVGEAALIGGTMAASQVLGGRIIPLAALTLLGAGKDGGIAWVVIASIAGYGIMLDELIASCAPAISDIPIVDQLVKCTLLGAAVGVGMYGLFGSRNNQAKADEPAPDAARKFAVV